MAFKSLKHMLSKAFGRAAAPDVQSSQNDIGTSDAHLIVPKSKQAGLITRALISHAGGYDPQYYTKDEAKSATVLAAAKFASVTLATYSFMKAVYPAFESSAIRALPSIGSLDTKYLLAGTAAGALWWGISKLDTAVMHEMRAQKAAKHAATALGVKAEGHDKSTWPGLMFRFGISAGSLGISIPALLVTSSEGTINDYIRRSTNQTNAPVIVEYQERLTNAERYLAELRNRVSSLQNMLVDASPIEQSMTEMQRKRLEDLSNLISNLQRQKEQEEANRLEQIRLRDAAISRAEQEAAGTRGSRPGRAQLWANAIADRDDAIRVIGTIDASLARISERVAETNSEIAQITSQAEERNQQRQGEIDRQRPTIQAQLERVQAEVRAQSLIRDSLADVGRLASQDPRYKNFNPDLAEQVGAYMTYMREEANALDWSRAGFMALMIICMELGVFALASSRKLSPGEVRGYLAELIKTQEAGNTFKRLIENQNTKAAYKLDDETINLGKQVRVTEVDAAIFEDTLARIKADPELRAQVFDDVAAMLHKRRAHPANDSATGIPTRLNRAGPGSPA